LSQIGSEPVPSPPEGSSPRPAAPEPPAERLAGFLGLRKHLVHGILDTSVMLAPDIFSDSKPAVVLAKSAIPICHTAARAKFCGAVYIEASPEENDLGCRALAIGGMHGASLHLCHSFVRR
jgi:hypothetical protein